MHEADAGIGKSGSLFNHWSLLISLPPQYMTVAFHPLETVSGNMAVDAEAGYVRTACGTSGRSSWPTVKSRMAAARLILSKTCPLGRRCAIG